MSEGKSETAGAAPAAAPVIRPAPLSPHILQWRWHVTMAASILTRFTGVALYGGLLIIALGVLSLANGPDTYAAFTGMMGSWLGHFILFGITFSVFYHLAAGIRHLVWDLGKGFEPKTANMTAIGAIFFGLAAAIVVWGLAVMTGGA
jgi:succinate dehydrogenase / fumarate reductase cytochrome b subunit